jgi:hypothetical protein
LYASSKALHSVISPSPPSLTLRSRPSKCIFRHPSTSTRFDSLDNNNPIFWTVFSEPQRHYGPQNSSPTRGDSENHPEYSQTTL